MAVTVKAVRQAFSLLYESFHNRHPSVSQKSQPGLGAAAGAYLSPSAPPVIPAQAGIYLSSCWRPLIPNFASLPKPSASPNVELERKLGVLHGVSEARTARHASRHRGVGT
jgi:hypothetical protein